MRSMMGNMMPGMMMPWMAVLLIAPLVPLIIVPLVLYMMMERSGATKVAGLTSIEHAVVKLLMERGGSSTQREIALALNISRLKAHRLITSLKNRGVVEVEPMGRTNLVKLNVGHDEVIQ
jgi:uncharacterized membrane protein